LIHYPRNTRSENSLAAELTKSASGERPSPGRVVRTNILTGPHRRWCSIRAKSAECFCNDPIYRDYYAERWSDSEQAGMDGR